jgi:curli biogenesis system outer membrane secretion channel CsgG
MAKGEVPVPVGAAVRTNTTPMEPALACLADLIAQKGDKQRVIAVGEVKDYTGKYSINEGSAITQGGALMVYSALGKMGDAVAVAERYDPLVAERELGYIDRRQLGNGEEHTVNGAKVAWVPYFGGTIAQSDYFIVGGITELNYNIRSGGVDIALNNIGPKVRTFTQSVAVDLRIVDSRSLIVLKTVSLTKQFTGYEVGANVFRFFGNDLFDITVGAKGQEPLQLGIRTALEEATIRLNIDKKR